MMYPFFQENKTESTLIPEEKDLNKIRNKY